LHEMMPVLRNHPQLGRFRHSLQTGNSAISET
jgi:hypothetical protein